MEKPLELQQAELVFGLCKSFQALPYAGGVMDQRVSLLRMYGILEASGYFEKDA